MAVPPWTAVSARAVVRPVPLVTGEAGSSPIFSLLWGTAWEFG